MTFNPDIHNRRSIRLKNYDYSSCGLYFVTICTQNRQNLFGEIIDGKMILNNAGKMIYDIWQELKKIFQNIQLHEFVIMPNHIHGIIEITIGTKSIVGAESTVGAESISALDYQNLKRVDMESQRVDMESTPTIPIIIQTFKRYTTTEYIKMVKNNQLPQFEKRIWQRNYYEHIIRDEKSYFTISEYIINNPLKWEFDSLNTKNTK